MKKKVIISYLVKTWIQKHPQGSEERKNLYCKVEYLENCINRQNTKDDVLNAYKDYQKGARIETIMCCLLDMKQIRKALY